MNEDHYCTSVLYSILIYVGRHSKLSWDTAGQGGKAIVGDARYAADTPFLVYPDKNKPELLSSPGKELCSAAMAVLNDVDTIVIVGYGFPISDREKHPFVKAIDSSLISKRVLIVDPNAECVAEGTTTAKKIPECFECVFCNEGIARFCEKLGREPHLEPGSSMG